MFPADKRPQPQVSFFDADTAARVINIAPYPYKLMFIIAAVCGLRIGEVTALKVASIDFKRKLLRVTGALDYATRKESTPKSGNSAAPVHMSELLAKHLHDWLDKHYKPSLDGYLFTNSKGKPYLSDNVVKYGIHRAMAKLGIETAKGVHVGIHCFRHGVTSELLESGTPIHVVTGLMRHADSKVTLDHYAHIVGDTERVASEKFSQRIGQNITKLESDPPIGVKLQILSPHKQRAWRKRVGVEPTTRLAKSRIAGFEGREGHRTPFASAGCKTFSLQSLVEVRNLRSL